MRNINTEKQYDQLKQSDRREQTHCQKGHSLAADA